MIIRSLSGAFGDPVMHVEEREQNVQCGSARSVVERVCDNAGDNDGCALYVGAVLPGDAESEVLQELRA